MSNFFNQNTLQGLYGGVVFLAFGSWVATIVWYTSVFDGKDAFFADWTTGITMRTFWGILFNLLTIGSLMLAHVVSLRAALPTSAARNFVIRVFPKQINILL